MHVALEIQDQLLFLLLNKSIAEELHRHNQNHNDKDYEADEGARRIRFHIDELAIATHRLLVLGLLRFVMLILK